MKKTLNFLGWLLVAAGAILECYQTWLIVAALALTGCASYWVKTGPALKVEIVQEVENIYAYCYRPDLRAGTRVQGCMVPMYLGFPRAGIFLLRGMSPDDRACVLSHEQAHAEGWRHDDRETYRLDCGPT